MPVLVRVLVLLLTITAYLPMAASPKHLVQGMSGQRSSEDSDEEGATPPCLLDNGSQEDIDKFWAAGTAFLLVLQERRAVLAPVHFSAPIWTSHHSLIYALHDLRC